MRATLSVIAYNPKNVADKDAPKTWKDLLNSRWSGKEVTAHPGYSGIIMIANTSGFRERMPRIFSAFAETRSSGGLRCNSRTSGLITQRIAEKIKPLLDESGRLRVANRGA